MISERKRHGTRRVRGGMALRREEWSKAKQEERGDKVKNINRLLELRALFDLALEHALPDDVGVQPELP